MRSGFGNSTTLLRCLALALGCLMADTRDTRAFPPGPPHQVYGMVRDRIGNPLDGGAVVLFEAASGTVLRADIAIQNEPRVNYRLDVPMDCGLTLDLYAPTALRPTAPFRLRVQVGSVTYLPMEMAGDLSSLGLPGQKTRIDLTLGVDADGNGLPDDWEKAVAAFLRRPWVAGGIRPDDPYPGTGMTYRDVYIAGVYAMAPKDGIGLGIVTRAGDAPKLAFTVVKGRSYSIEAATRVGEWTPVAFRLPPDGGPVTWLDAYLARDTRQLEIEAPSLPDGPARFFRLRIE